MRKKLSENIEEGVLEKHKSGGEQEEEYTKAEVSRRSGGWSRESKYQPRKWREDCCARIFLWFREYDLQRMQKNAGKPDGKGGDEAAAKDESHDRYDKEKQIKGQNGRKQ